jgi:hypothetical protein
MTIARTALSMAARLSNIRAGSSAFSEGEWRMSRADNSARSRIVVSGDFRLWWSWPRDV